LADDLASSGLGSPSVIVIGDVVRCADQMLALTDNALNAA
jgi:siroheme synthase